MRNNRNISINLIDKIIYFAIVLFLSVPVNGYLQYSQKHFARYQTEVVHTPASKSNNGCFRFPQLKVTEKQEIKNCAYFQFALSNYNQLVNCSFIEQSKIVESIDKLQFPSIVSARADKEEDGLMS